MDGTDGRQSAEDLAEDLSGRIARYIDAHTGDPAAEILQALGVPVPLPWW